MPRRLTFLVAVSFAILAGAAFWLDFSSDRALANDGEDKVEELMETVHEYPISPWPLAKDASRKEPVDWETINKALPKLELMSKALAETKEKEVRELADGYIGGVKALRAGADKKDTAATRAAVMKLSKSCVDCHFDGGPAGEIEEE